MHPCVHTMYLPAALSGQKTAWDPLELELWKLSAAIGILITTVEVNSLLSPTPGKNTKTHSKKTPCCEGAETTGLLSCTWSFLTGSQKPHTASWTMFQQWEHRTSESEHRAAWQETMQTALWCFAEARHVGGHVMSGEY